jgi:hypothetical protein
MEHADRESIAITQAAAEMTVLTELDETPMFAIEIKPQDGQTEKDIKEAVERCEATGWIKFGPASHYDPRAHLTDDGRAELASRQR